MRNDFLEVARSSVDDFSFYPSDKRSGVSLKTGHVTTHREQSGKRVSFLVVVKIVAFKYTLVPCEGED